MLCILKLVEAITLDEIDQKIAEINRNLEGMQGIIAEHEKRENATRGVVLKPSRAALK